VLFLDDLQWADPGSLRLLELILLDPERRYVLIVGAYRDNEVGGEHPLTRTVEALRKARVDTTEIRIGPLGADDVTALLSEALDQPAASVAPLAQVVVDKTQGNPFFMNQFLGTLHAERLLRFDARSGAWGYEIDKIRAHQVTENVVD